jgi:hypothetical protein
VILNSPGFPLPDRFPGISVVQFAADALFVDSVAQDPASGSSRYASAVREISIGVSRRRVPFGIERTGSPRRRVEGRMVAHPIRCPSTM